jgi:hypothetical protein
VKAETKTLLESGSQSPSKLWPKPPLVRNSSGKNLNRRRAEALCLSAPPKTEVSSFADPRGTEVPSIVEGQSFESFFDSSFATQLLRFRSYKHHVGINTEATSARRRINLRGIRSLQADKEPLRSGASPSERRLPSPQWPKPHRILVRGPPVVMLPVTPAAFAT